MAEVVCDTSPLQYLHQIRLLHLLPSLAAGAVIPPAVEKEILAGKAQGIDLDDALARRESKALEIPFTGTLGLLLPDFLRRAVPGPAPGSALPPFSKCPLRCPEACGGGGLIRWAR